MTTLTPATDTAPRERYNATVLAVRRVHDELMILRVRPDAPFPVFEAGQYTAVGIGSWEPGPAGEGRPPDSDGILRSYYSISSPILDDDGRALLRPANETFLEFYIAHDGAPLTARLFDLHDGGRLWLAERASGATTLAPVGPDDDVLFLATGTGEAPHNSMIAELLRRDHAGRIASVVCCRRQADLGYRVTHQRLMALYPRYAYVPMTTRDGPAPRHRIQARLADGSLEAATGITLDPGRCHVYLCGNAAMVGRPRDESGRRAYPAPAGVIEILETRFGFSAGDDGRPGNLHFERY